MGQPTRDPIIDQLVEDLTPVRRTPPISFRLFATIIPGLFIVLGGSYFLGWDRVIEHRLSQWSFWLEQALLIITSVSAAYSALALSIPGRSSRKKRVIPLISLALWSSLLFLLLSQWALSSSHDNLLEGLHPTFFCPSVLLIMALPLGFILGRIVVRGAVFNNLWTGLFIALSASAMAAFGLQLSCYIGNPLHLIVFHLLPALLITSSGVLIGYKLLTWKQ